MWDAVTTKGNKEVQNSEIYANKNIVNNMEKMDSPYPELLGNSNILKWMQSRAEIDSCVRTKLGGYGPTERARTCPQKHKMPFLVETFPTLKHSWKSTLLVQEYYSTTMMQKSCSPYALSGTSRLTQTDDVNPVLKASDL